MSFRTLVNSRSEPRKTSKMELFAKIVNGGKLLIIFIKNCIVHVRLDSRYANDLVFLKVGNSVLYPDFYVIDF